MELITGYAGQAHITSEQAGATNAAAIGNGQYVFEIGECFDYSIENSNEIVIKDGYGINQGRFFCMEAGETESLTITSGTAGTKRRDLIVVRYSKNTTTNIEQAQLVVVEGTPGDDYTTPSIESGNILENATVSDFALYQVDVDGIAIDSVTALFEIGGGAASKVGFVGTRAEVDAAIEDGKIKEGMQVIVTDDITPITIEAASVAYTTPSGSASNVKSELDTLNNNLANLETATSHLGNRLSYITECAVGSSKTISNYKKYAIIFLCLNSGSTMVACMPFGASETDLRFNDGTNHTARVTYSISGDDITFTVTNRENASGYAVLFRALTIV